MFTGFQEKQLAVPNTKDPEVNVHFSPTSGPGAANTAKASGNGGGSTATIVAATVSVVVVGVALAGGLWCCKRHNRLTGAHSYKAELEMPSTNVLHHTCFDSAGEAGAEHPCMRAVCCTTVIFLLLHGNSQCDMFAMIRHVSSSE